VRGIDIPLAQVREDARIDESLESLQVALSPHGIHARGIRIEGAREIATLDTPTLLQHVDGTWILLRACRRGRGIIETADGLSEIALSDLSRRLAGQALEVTPSLPEGRGLWPRIRQLLSAHRGILLQFAFASLALQSLALLTPELTGQVMGKALPDSAVGLLRLIAAAVVAVAVFTGAVSWLRERIILYLLARLELSIKRGFLEHVLHLPFPYLQARSLGDLLQAFYGIASARALLAEKPRLFCCW
jgi:ATP-binding cassette, subfamily B, bacterial